MVTHLIVSDFADLAVVTEAERTDLDRERASDLEAASDLRMANEDLRCWFALLDLAVEDSAEIVAEDIEADVSDVAAIDDDVMEAEAVVEVDASTEVA